MYLMMKSMAILPPLTSFAPMKQLPEVRDAAMKQLLDVDPGHVGDDFLWDMHPLICDLGL